MRDDELMHYASRGAEFLAHHGVKGQKWGKRRYQNLDGSLTPEGRIHYGYNSDETSGAYGLPDHEYGGHYSGRAEGRGSSSNGRRGPYANDKEYGPEDYEDVDYRDIDVGNAKYKESDVEERMQSAINRQPKMSGREKFATAAVATQQTVNALTKDQKITDANGKQIGTAEAPLRTMARIDKERKQAMARQMNAQSIQNLTDDQLRYVINRKSLEKQYLDATTPEVKSGYEKTMQILQVAGAVAGTSMAVLQVANMVRSEERRVGKECH